MIIEAKTVNSCLVLKFNLRLIFMLQNLKELYKYRELLWVLTQREIKVRYKQTVLGVLWAILQPLSLMLIFTLVFSYFTKINSEGLPYPIFSYAALLPWTFFQTAVQFGSMSVVNNSGLVTKIWFPREILPLSAIFAALVDFLIAGIILLAMIFFYNISPTWNLLWILLLIPLQLIITIGIIFFASALVVIFRDLKFAVPLLLQLLFYGTPIIYSINNIPDRFFKLILANPLTGLIDSYRQVLLQGNPPQFYYLFSSTVIGTILLITGYLFYKKVDKKFADII